jgi:hypothetical protein
VCCHLLSRKPTLPYLNEKLVRWNKKRVHPQQPTDDYERLRSHDIHCRGCANFGQIVVTDRRIIFALLGFQDVGGLFAPIEGVLEE